MPVDFKANQIRTSQLSASGSNASNAAILVYDVSAATNDVGTYTPSLRTTVGNDTFLFVSGSIGSKNTSVKGTTLFGGDSVISGSLTAEKGLSGSLTQLWDGRSYLVAGSNVTINSSSNGQVVISSTGGGGGGSSPEYWVSNTPNSIFTTGSASATFLSSSIGLQVTGSITTTGSFTHTGSFRVYDPSEGTINLISSVGDSVLTHVSDGNLYLTNNNTSGEVIVGATNSGGAGRQILRLNASLTTGNVYLSGSTYIGVDSYDSLYVNSRLASDIIPDGNRTRNLGSESNRFANIYTGDLHLRNERGNWTIVEEEDFLCVVNNLTGKKYKMMLQSID